MLKKIVRAKKYGSANIVSATLVSILAFTGLYLMVMLLINTYQSLDNMNRISCALRSYVTKMEVTGYLEEKDIKNFVTELQDLGMTTVSLSGNFANGISHVAIANNLGPAEYGEEVLLRIQGELVVKSIEEISTGIWNFTIGEKELEVDISQKGISVR